MSFGAVNEVNPITHDQHEYEVDQEAADLVSSLKVKADGIGAQYKAVAMESYRRGYIAGGVNMMEMRALELQRIEQEGRHWALGDDQLDGMQLPEAVNEHAIVAKVSSEKFSLWFLAESGNWQRMTVPGQGPRATYETVDDALEALHMASSKYRKVELRQDVIVAFQRVIVTVTDGHASDQFPNGQHSRIANWVETRR